MKDDSFWTRLQEGRLTRRRLLSGAALGGAGLVAAAVIGCGGDDEEATSQPSGGGGQAVVKHGSLNIGSIGSQTLSPNSTASWPSEYYAIYDQLTRIGADGKMEPALATKWELDPNNKSAGSSRCAMPSGPTANRSPPKMSSTPSTF